MTVEHKFENGSDKFPVGMRVLAVDDDPACLRLLEVLLRKCQYHVTTTNQAALALQMLRENKDNFDLIISDVCMPDMNGFKLLELVGLEMDLPVIMLSAYGDTETVTKGIRHGACDYLLKPVRYEALKLIWQHVVRRKVDKKRHGENEEVGDGFSDQNESLTKKRKDQYEKDDTNEHEEDKDKNSESSGQKKPRVVWTGELHRKFVAAVDYLGFDKAVPKSILQMMNEEKITRENVASHLQKYRMYLKRISCVSSQQSSLVTAPLRRLDSAYWRTGPVNLPTFVGFENALSSHPRNTTLGRLNSPAGMGILGVSSPGIFQGSEGQMSTNAITNGTNFGSLVQPESQNGNILQGVPLPLDPNPSQYSQPVTDEPMIYPISSGLSGGRTNVGSSSYALSHTYNNSLENQYSVLANSLKSELPSQLLDIERHDDNCPGAVQSSSIQSISYVNDYFGPQLASKGKDAQGHVSPLSSNGGEIRNFRLKKELDDHEQYAPQQYNAYRTMNTSVGPNSVDGLWSQSQDPGSSVSYVENGSGFIGQSSGVDLLSLQHNEEHMVQMTPFENNAHDCAGSLEDIVTAMMKEKKGEVISKEGHHGSDTYSFSAGNCIYT